jgi:hypothetical protein
MRVEIDGKVYCCGTCHWWVRGTGCTMPPSPSTVNCGCTQEDDLCEQWTEKEQPTALERHRAKINNPYIRHLRQQHYLDNSIYGTDS